MRGNGKIAKNTERASIYGPMAINITDSINTGKDRDMEQ
jgi:hypothetical protein